jgi:hypothetical protein
VRGSAAAIPRLISMPATSSRLISMNSGFTQLVIHVVLIQIIQTIPSSSTDRSMPSLFGLFRR